MLLPARLSVSALVALARDPDALARQVRRPMPQPPAGQARKGTAFHRWLEERFGQQRLIDDDDLFAEEDEGPDENLIELRAQFEAGAVGPRHWRRPKSSCRSTLLIWRPSGPRPDRRGLRQPGRDLRRGRAGRPASRPGASRRRTRWPSSSPPTGSPGPPWPTSRLARSGATEFYYVRRDRTVRPADLLDEAGLVGLINRVPVSR